MSTSFYIELDGGDIRERIAGHTFTGSRRVSKYISVFDFEDAAFTSEIADIMIKNAGKYCFYPSSNIIKYENYESKTILSLVGESTGTNEKTGKPIIELSIRTWDDDIKYDSGTYADKKTAKRLIMEKLKTVEGELKK
jgi:hypothetical protein